MTATDDHSQAEVLLDPVRWLAPQVCDALVLLLVHSGELEQARSRITSSYRGYHGGGSSFQVQGARVRYDHQGQTGSLTVARLVAYAAEQHHPETGQHLADAYRRYVQAATRRTGTTAEQQTTYRDASRALDQAEAAWWTSGPQQLDLVDLLGFETGGEEH